MGVGVTVEFKRATLAQIDKLGSKSDSKSGASKGQLFHWSTQADTGIQIVDDWESQDEFRELAAD